MSKPARHGFIENPAIPLVLKATGAANIGWVAEGDHRALLSESDMAITLGFDGARW